MSASPRRAIFGSIAVSIAFVMELTLIPLLLPAIQSQFNLSIAEIAWVFNSYGVAVAMGVILGGWLGDVFDAKKVFGLGVLFFASGSIISACAGSFEVIITGRVLQGFGGGVFSPLVPLLLTRASPHRPGKVLIIWGSVAGYVAAFAPLIFSRALIDYSWQLAFVLFAVISLVALAVVSRSYTADDSVYLRQTRPNYSTLIRSRDLWLLFGYVYFTYGSITYFLFRLPLWMSENEYDVIIIGAILSSFWLSFSIFSTLLRNRVDGPHIRIIIFSAPALIVTGFSAAFIFDNILLLFPSAVLVGAGLACSNSTSTQMILNTAPKGMRAISASLDITFARLGGVMTVAWFANVEIYRSVLLVSIMSLLAMLCVGVCVRRAD